MTAANRLLAAAAGGLVALSAVAGAAYAAASRAFTDVGEDHEHAAEIVAAHQIGVFNGYGDGTFRPDGELSRGQAENVIWRMLSWHGTDDDGNFEITRADAAVLAMTGLCGLDPDRIPGCAQVASQNPPASGTSDPEAAAPQTSTPSTPTSIGAPVKECPSSYHGHSGRTSTTGASYVWFYGGYDRDGNPWCMYRQASISRGSNRQITSKASDTAWCQTHAEHTDALGTIPVVRTETVRQGYRIVLDGPDRYSIQIYHPRGAGHGRPVAGEGREWSESGSFDGTVLYRGPGAQGLNTALVDAHSSGALVAGLPPRVLQWLGTHAEVVAACFDAAERDSR